jgi:hypothetical protein
MSSDSVVLTTEAFVHGGFLGVNLSGIKHFVNRANVPSPFPNWTPVEVG